MGVGGLLWLSAILFMARTAQHAEPFSQLHPWILMINVAGLVVLLALLATKLTQLVRDWRGHVIGSRLKARMVWTFGVLATLPILLVYFFACSSSNRGIDSLVFNVEIRQSLDDALCCRARRSRPHARPPRRHRDDRERLSVSGGRCRQPRDAPPAGRRDRDHRGLRGRRDRRHEQGAVERRGAGRGAREVLLQVRQGRPFVSLEPLAEGGYLIPRPCRSRLPGDRAAWWCRRPTRSGSGSAPLADTVQAAYQQFGEKDYLRKPLKASFILTLTVVLLLSLLAAWYGAIFTGSASSSRSRTS